MCFLCFFEGGYWISSGNVATRLQCDFLMFYGEGGGDLLYRMGMWHPNYDVIFNVLGGILDIVLECGIQITMCIFDVIEGILDIVQG